MDGLKKFLVATGIIVFDFEFFIGDRCEKGEGGQMSQGAISSYVEGVLSAASSSFWSINRSDFNRNRRSKDGLGVHSKECGNRRARKDYERKRTAAGRHILFEDPH